MADKDTKTTQDPNDTVQDKAIQPVEPVADEATAEAGVEAPDVAIETPEMVEAELSPEEQAELNEEMSAAEADSQEAVDETLAGEVVAKTDPNPFRAGDTVRVHYKIVEGDKSRIQPYQGIVISRKGAGEGKTFTVRRIGANNIGVERIFPFLSPNITKLEVLKRGKVRRAQVYYLRNKKGRAATKIKELAA